MIYTMTLNPALDYNMVLDSFVPGHVNRSSHEYFHAGGKGLMVSQMLSRLGMDSTAFGLVAGYTGDEITRMLREAGIHTNFVRLSQGMTRINVKLWGGLNGEINAGGPPCDEKSLTALLEKLSVLSFEDTLVLAGTVPGSLPHDLYARILVKLKGKQTKVVVDATGELLRSVIPYHPFLVKPNHHELSEIFDVELTTKEEVAPYAKKLREEGAENVLVSMAGDGAVLAAADGSVWFAKAPEGQVKNTVGSGDSMVAGFVYSYLSLSAEAEEARRREEKSSQQSIFASALSYGIATGSATAFSDELATKDEVEALLKELTIWRVE